jgi:hypothetical protein
MLSVLAALVVVGSAAATGPQLPGTTTSASFYPCPGQTDFSRGPILSECTDTTQKVTGTCNPTGDSILSLTVTGGASPPFAGTYEETITWTIGPQDLPAQPAFFPFPGPPSESHQLPTGKLTDLTATFKITSGATVIEGTKSFLDNDGNWGVCRQLNNEPKPSGGPNLTGYFIVLNAGVLAYEVTSGIPLESGVGETYIMNSYATCCDAGPPTGVNIATGHLKEGFGTTHAAAGTSNTVAVDEGVPATPLPGVSLTFPDVGTGGASATAILTASAPELPSNFAAGNPPATYDITATGDFTFPVRVCIGYGSLPAGTTEPALLHFENGDWVEVTTDWTGDPDRKVCGNVDSFSQFAAVGKLAAYTLTGPFQPVDAYPMTNKAKAGQTIPVKFSLGGNFGLDVFADGYPRSDGGPCSGGPTDDIETTSNGAGLAYDAATGVYTYHWQTSKQWAGHCRTLSVRFNDGSGFQANFQFKP